MAEGSGIRSGTKGKRFQRTWACHFEGQWRGTEHFGENGTYILKNRGSGYFVGQRREKCQKEEQCVQNNLTKICFRGDSTAGMTKP